MKNALRIISTNPDLRYKRAKKDNLYINGWNQLEYSRPKMKYRREIKVVYKGFRFYCPLL